MPGPNASASNAVVRAAPFARSRGRVGFALLVLALVGFALGLARGPTKTGVPASLVAASNLSAAARSIAPETTPFAASASAETVQPEAEPPGFMGRPELELLERLRREPLTAARKGSGGRTLAFKVTLASGIKAYLKPEQSVSSANWYAEVAAYHLDRALGLGRVPAVTSRRFAWTPLEKAADGDRRIPEVKVGRDGSVRAALVAWLNEPLVPATTPRGWENWVRSEPFPRTTPSPYRRPAAYGSALARIHERAVQRLPRELFYDEVPAITERDLPAALSDMIVFDFLTLNYDRFGGDNANVLTLGAKGPLVFLDNGDGFSAGPVRRQLLDDRLAPLSRFRRRTIDALRALDMQAFATRLAREPLAPILTDRALAGLAARRAIVLEHVAAQQRRYGDVIYAW